MSRFTNDARELIERLPGKDCGLCGRKTCAEFAHIIQEDPALIDRCPHCAENTTARPHPPTDNENGGAAAWRDHLGREYEFILDKFPDEHGPRETILLFNPTNVEKLNIKKGDVIFGRPGWISCGCPISHAGIVVEEPDYFNGTIVWNVTGPLVARERGIDIGYYNTVAYEGLVNQTRCELRIGMRYYFLPRFCMLQWRHCGLINSLGKTPAGMHVRLEGLFIG